MKDGYEIVHNEMIYKYNKFYDRFEAKDKTSMFGIICSKCHSSFFSISYGNWECVATCVCGHSFVIYDG